MRLKNLVISLMAFCTFSQSVLADCDFSTGITKGPNKTFTYTEACHQKVGALVQDDKIKTQQLDDLNKAITLKDLALKDSDQRAQDWMNTSGTLEKRVQEIDKLEETNKFLYFGLGVLATGFAAYTAAKLTGK